MWHTRSMTRVRVSTTVDEHLLRSARQVCNGRPDSALLDEALRALLSRHRAAEINSTYSVYDDHPFNEPDEWGDLTSFREAAGAS
jgi:hypothetical protein